ncbi:HIT family protein [Nocardioides gansuensis]|nr:HIT domain-containing protein [Nocardioides gansuensis]
MDQDGIGEPGTLERLWTPHRMAYIRGEGRPEDDESDECPFCRIPRLEDGAGLVVARGALCYAVLNLHPYNPGHLMVVPFRHVAGLEELTRGEAVELMTMTQEAVATIRRVSDPDALNIGLNLGRAAGGSLAAHLHQHVVPRWTGDANFITVTADTKVLPQLLHDTRDLLAGAWE